MLKLAVLKKLKERRKINIKYYCKSIPNEPLNYKTNHKYRLHLTLEILQRINDAI